MFDEYVKHGWALVPITPGEKGPRHKGWSARENCITSIDQIGSLKSAGLAHAYSKTCAIDVDNLEYARAKLLTAGIDLDAHLAAVDAVRIERGDPNRTKLLYALDTPLVTLKPFNGLELRCASRSGRTLQDVLPPSLHPSGNHYEWVYNDPLVADWSALPDLPTDIRAYWEAALVPHVPAEAAQHADADELSALLQGLDSDCGYDEWLRVGMALHHASDGADAGLQLWNQWSSQATSYQGFADLQPHWASFNSGGSAPVTVNSLRGAQTADFSDFEIVVPKASQDAWEAAGAEQEAAAAEAFAFTHISEWVNREPPAWLIEDVLPQADMAMIYGASGSGKTFWALDLAMTVASGRLWRERATVHAPVAWVAAEAAGSVRNRALAYAAEHSLSLADIDLHVTGTVPNLSDPGTVKALITAILPIKPAIVVIDTLSAASGGANENSGEDMNTVLAACRAMHAATGSLVLLIHHSGKDAARGARGWSGIKAAMDAEIEIVEMQEGSRTARISKLRDGEIGDIFGFILRPVDESCVVDHSEYRAPATFGISPQGYMQELVYTQALKLVPVGENRIGVDVLRDATAEVLTHEGGGRDQRKPRVARAIDRMVAANIFERVDDDLVLIHVGFTAEDFNDE